MNRFGLYRVLMGTLGIAALLFGLGLLATFFLYQRPGSTPMVPTGPIGHYFIALAGSALLGWGGAMVGAARDPISLASRMVGASTAFVFVLMALLRMVAWWLGDYASWLADIPRKEATALLVLALLLVWLRPTRAETISSRTATIRRTRRKSDPVSVDEGEPA
jgi:hypothetical protein